MIDNNNSSRIIIEDFNSESLKGNPLKDPSLRRVPVYLPPNYTTKKEYPSLYLLSSFGARGLKMLQDDLWEENIQQKLDRLINEGRMQAMLVVMPDASTRYGGSQYVNSIATGKYEDHILELVSYIDANYSTKQDRGFRAIAGHSSGGFAATRFGMLHSDIFGLVADHSGDKYFELTYRTDFPNLLRFLERNKEKGLIEFLRDPGKGLRDGASFHALALAATAACFSPNPKSNLGFDLPFDIYSGELRSDVWNRWLSFDPIMMIEENQSALKSLKLLYFDCGSYDEYNLVYGARIFSERLKDLKVPHRFEEFEGGHRNIRHRYDISFQAISEAIPQ